MKKIKRILTAVLAAALVVPAVWSGSKTVWGRETDSRLIRAVEALNEEERELHFGVRPALEELKAAMPDTISVYLDSEEEESAIPVEWEPRGGEYEGTSYYYYEFLPVLPEGYRTVPTMGELPAVSVYLTEDEESLAENGTLSSVYRPENMDKIFTFLRDEVGLNIAASCGVLANIYVESAFDPEAVNDGSGAYGLCQWTGGRKTNLDSYCQSNGWKVNKLKPQLRFLKYELEVLTGDSLDTLARLKAVKNTKSGAGKAAKIFCDVFERPNDPATSENRANVAKKYWEDKYGGKIYEGTERIVIKGCSINLSSEVTEFAPAGFTSSDPSVASVTSDGKVTGVSKGKCTIKATSGPASNDEKVFQIKVKAITLSGSRTIRTNEEFSLEEMLPDSGTLEDSGLFVTKYKSSNEKIFAVDQDDGTVTPKKNGKAKLKITFKYTASDDRSLSAGTLSVKFTLKKPEIKESTLTLKPGEKKPLTIANKNAKVELSLESQDTSVAEVVEENGSYYVKAVGAKGQTADLYLYLNLESEPADKVCVTLS